MKPTLDFILQTPSPGRPQAKDAIGANARAITAQAEIDQKLLEELHLYLLRWFAVGGRSFPWRETSDPYRVLIAEKLLQQTAARKHVISAYEELMRRYPRIEDMAQAKLSTMRKLLRPLGLTRRPRELIDQCKQIVFQHGGKVPEDLKSLKNLEGVGEYIARAILCFGYGHDIALVDTNIARWLYRLHGIRSPLPSNPARNRELLVLAQKLVPAGNARNYHWAVIDLCASICLRKKPLCSTCPIQQSCIHDQHSIARRSNKS